MKANRALILSAFALSLALHADASTILFSTFGPGNSFTPAVGYQIGGGYLGFGLEEVGVEFTPAVDSRLTQIRVAVFSSFSHGDGDLVLEVSQGDLPGTLIDTFSTTVVGGIATFDSVRQPELFGGEPYWIVATSNDLVDNFLGWNINDIGYLSSIAGRYPGQSLWEVNSGGSPAFEVSGLPLGTTAGPPIGSGAPMQGAPEPSTLWTLGGGLLLILASTLRKWGVSIHGPL